MDVFLKNSLILLMLMALLGGCISTQRKNSSLEDTLRAYKNALRWKEMKDAHDFVRPDLRKPISKLSKLPRVVSYKAIEGPKMDSADLMSQTVEIEYYENNNIKLKTIIDNQTWEYEPETRRWWLISHPVFLENEAPESRNN